MYVGAFLELEYENQHPVEYEHLIRCYVARTKWKRQQSLTFNFFLYYWWTDGEAISSREANAEFRKVNLRFWWVKTHYHEKLQKSDYACYHVNLDKPVFRDEKHVNASSRLWFHALKQSMCSIKGDCICYCLLSDIHFSSISFFLLIQFRVVGGLETITGTKLHPGDQRANT